MSLYDIIEYETDTRRRRQILLSLLWPEINYADGHPRCVPSQVLIYL